MNNENVFVLKTYSVPEVLKIANANGFTGQLLPVSEVELTATLKERVLVLSTMLQLMQAVSSQTIDPERAVWFAESLQDSRIAIVPERFINEKSIATGIVQAENT